jgi:hypothetical protein
VPLSEPVAAQEIGGAPWYLYRRRPSGVEK